MNQNEGQSGSTNPPKISPQDLNLITFTPLHEQYGAVQGAVGEQNEPKKQRSPRRRKAKNDWQLNQRQFDQNNTQEISHVSPKLMFLAWRNQVCRIYSYLQEKSRRITDSAKDVVRLEIGNVIVRLQCGADSVHQKHMQLKPAEGIQT